MTFLPFVAVIFIAGMAIIVLRFGRPAPQNRGRAVLASKMDRALTLEEIQNQIQNFDIFYSGQSSMPSAMIWIPKDSPVHWKLKGGAKGWKQVEDEPKLLDLLHRIHRENGDGAWKLWILLPPPSLEHLHPGYTYLWSVQALNPQRVPQEQKTIAVHPRPEYNSSVYGAR